jgi:hypothetical protein
MSFRRNSNRPPFNSFEPVFEATLICPPGVLPFSAVNSIVSIWNSWMASVGMASRKRQRQGNSTKDQVRPHDAERLGLQVCLVKILGSH